MEIILLEKVPNLGGLGTMVKVKAGYARNYLIPHGKAVLATKDNVANFEARRAELEKAQHDKLASAQDRAAQLQEMTVVISGKVGVEGKLFGSVSAGDIAQALTGAGIAVDRHEIRLQEGPIRFVGEHEVAVHLHPDVNVLLTVQVVSEN
ncbi:50S ribosomal protein L9 [Beggiatoa leptomitoformis]|uniref:Large ribosomal subunit protein bL9 n=1 Tax=Beggiatoa leptomitoformis TaxID=288004 RepID=A0A2N9YB49_9GAMM|nr:50S ribosomal protein L9 [Beggiatoa leptomitoformis]ALG66926.1 50S ribosomal protein L9 [Beggiatoa leptomitoformis]AUI67708.1 50S ribosomal protein L9 [Beggiatoa leptomitoformis]